MLFTFYVGIVIPEFYRKNPIFGDLNYGTKTPKNSSKKIQKMIFLAIYPGTKSPILRPKNFSKLFWLHLVPGTIVPGTKCSNYAAIYGWYTIHKIFKNVGSTWY